MTNPYVPTIVTGTSAEERIERMFWHLKTVLSSGESAVIYCYTLEEQEALKARWENVNADNLTIRLTWEFCYRDKVPKNIATHPITADKDLNHFFFGATPREAVALQSLQGTLTYYEQVYIELDFRHTVVEGMYDKYAINLGIDQSVLRAG